MSTDEQMYGRLRFLPSSQYGGRKKVPIERVKSSFDKSHQDYFKYSMNLEFMHKSILVLGQKILKKLDDSNALQMENDLHSKLREYVLKLNEEVENYQIELKTYMEKEFRKEKKRLEEEFEALMMKIEKQRDNLEEERIKMITRKMNDENEESLRIQWKDAEELRNKAIEQLREQIRNEFQTLYEAIKQREIREALEKATQEFKIKELITVTKIREECEIETRDKIKSICETNDKAMETLLQRHREVEEKLKRETEQRLKIQADFRLLQADYKRFIDYTGHYNSDYMMKLRHIAENTIADNEFDGVLDKMLCSSISPTENANKATAK